MDDWRLWEVLQPETVVSVARFRNVIWACREAIQAKVAGDFVECGVWRGGLCALMGVMAQGEGKGRKVVAFDSFRGLPQPLDKDVDFQGRSAKGCAGLFAVGRDKLDALMARVAPGCAYDVYEGWFKDTLPTYKGEIAVLRLDSDWYESTRECLEAMYGKVASGGVVIVDDYGHWQGCREAVDEFRAANGIVAPMTKVDYTAIWWRKA